VSLTQTTNAHSYYIMISNRNCICSRTDGLQNSSHSLAKVKQMTRGEGRFELGPRAEDCYDALPYPVGPGDTMAPHQGREMSPVQPTVFAILSSFRTA
jgi:hypothetical protein